jgi:hypothetical protein
MAQLPERITLRLLCDELDDSKRQSLTRDLRRSLSEQGLEATLPLYGGSGPGTKTIGSIDWNAIILTLIGSGGVAVALIQVLKSYVERKSTLKIKITRTDGAEFLLTAENLNGKQQPETAPALEAFLKS